MKHGIFVILSGIYKNKGAVGSMENMDLKIHSESGARFETQLM